MLQKIYRTRLTSFLQERVIAPTTSNKTNHFPLMQVILTIIHPIHRFKLSDWLKEGHMTWISFDNFMLGN